MGSQGIGKLIRKKAPMARKEYNYSYYTGKSLVVDLYTWLYRFKIAMINQPYSSRLELNSTNLEIIKSTIRVRSVI